jgi:hypothetical protein
MVIGRPKEPGGLIPVILQDNELIPRNLNDEKVVIFRQGETTGRQLMMVKPLGVVLAANDPLLRPPAKPACNYALDPEAEDIGNPLHQHEDGTYWFYEATWNLEQGPYPTYEEAYAALLKYCVEYQKAVETQNETPAKTEDAK